MILELTRTLIGAQDFRLHLLQLGRDKSLSTHGCLLARVTRWHVREVRLGDLDEITKDGIETDLERLNPAFRDFPFLQFRNPILPVARSLPQFIEIRIESIAEHPAFLQDHRWIVHEGAIQFLREFRHFLKLTLQRLGERFRAHGFPGMIRSEREPIEQSLQRPFQLGDLLQRGFQRDEIARVSGGLAQPPRRAFQVPDRFQRMAQGRNQIGLVQQIGDHLLAPFQFDEISQRLQNPCPQLSPAHRSDGSVERGQQTGVACSPRLDQLEIHLRRGIEHDVIISCVATQGGQVVHLPPQLLLQIMNDGARGADRRRHVGAPEPVERFNTEMLAQSEARMLRQKCEIVVGKSAFDFPELRALPLAHQ